MAIPAGALHWREELSPYSRASSWLKTFVMVIWWEILPEYQSIELGIYALYPNTSPRTRGRSSISSQSILLSLNGVIDWLIPSIKVGLLRPAFL